MGRSTPPPEGNGYGLFGLYGGGSLRGPLRRSVLGSQWSPSTTPPRTITPKIPPMMPPIPSPVLGPLPPSPAPVFGPPPSRPWAPSPPLGIVGVGDGRGTAGADGSGTCSVVGEGAFCMTSVCGSSAFATTEGSGVAFTVGCFDLTAFGPDLAFFKTLVGEGAGEIGISVSGKLAEACCEARSRLVEDAS